MYKPCITHGNEKPTLNIENTTRAVLSSSRTCTEQAFGSLKGRFRRLKGIESTDITLDSKITVTCCILNNLCVKQGKILYIENTLC